MKIWSQLTAHGTKEILNVYKNDGKIFLELEPVNWYERLAQHYSV